MLVIYRRPKISLPEFLAKYRRLYKAGQALFTKFDLCGIKDGTCYNGRLTYTKKVLSIEEQRMASFCCSGCKYISSTGCQAEAIWCKLWTCHPIRDRRGLTDDMSTSLNTLVRQAGSLCMSYGGRRDLGDYVQMFYPEEYEAWKTTRTSIISTSSLSAS